MQHSPHGSYTLVTAKKTGAAPRQRAPGNKPRDGRVILHVFVEPSLRRAVHTLAAFDGINADDVIRNLVREELRRKGLPEPTAG